MAALLPSSPCLGFCPEPITCPSRNAEPASCQARQGGIFQSPWKPVSQALRQEQGRSRFATWTGGRRRGRENLQVVCIGWDPEGILGAPQPGHIARRQFQKRLEKNEDERAAFEKQVQMERERRRAAREARTVPTSAAGLIDFFLDTEAQEIEFEIARCRPRLDNDFFAHLKTEIGSLRFAINPSEQTKDRLVELEALEKALKEGTEAYDKVASNFISAKDRLAKILSAKDKKATILDMAGENQLDRSLLALLDQNIAAANSAGQEQAAGFMEKIRGAVVKYMTV